MDTETAAPRRSSAVGRRIAAAELVLFVVAVGMGVLWQLARPFSPDEWIQVNATLHLMKGGAFALPWAPSLDLSSLYEQHFDYFPPGYSLAILPFLAVFKDVWRASVALHITFFLLAAFAWRAILRRIRPSLGHSGAALLWLLWAATPTFAWFGWSNLVAFALFSAGTALVLETPLRAGRAAFAGFLFGLALFTRFQYGPLAIIACAVLAFPAEGARPAWKPAVWAAGPVLLIWAATRAYLFWSTGHGSYLDRILAPSPNWNVLVSFPPFAFNAIGLRDMLYGWPVFARLGSIPLDFMGDRNLLPNLLAEALQSRCAADVAGGLYAAFGHLASIAFVITAIRQARARPAAPASVLFARLALALALVNMAMLTCLDLRLIRRGDWLHMTDPRLLQPITAFVACVCVAGLLRRSGGRLLSRLKSAGAVGLVLLCVSFVPLRFRAIRAQVESVPSIWSDNRTRLAFEDLLERNKRDGVPLVYVEESHIPVEWIPDLRRRYAMVHFTTWALDQGFPIRTSKTVDLVVGLAAKDQFSPEMKAFLAAHGAQPIGTLLDVSFFKMTLPPE